MVIGRSGRMNRVAKYIQMTEQLKYNNKKIEMLTAGYSGKLKSLTEQLVLLKKHLTEAQDKIMKYKKTIEFLKSKLNKPEKKENA